MGVPFKKNEKPGRNVLRKKLSLGNCQAWLTGIPGRGGGEMRPGKRKPRTSTGEAEGANRTTGWGKGKKHGNWTKEEGIMTSKGGTSNRFSPTVSPREKLLPLKEHEHWTSTGR